MYRLLFVLLMFVSTGIYAQGSPVQQITQPKSKLLIKKDSSKVEIRKIDDQAVKSLSKNKEFIYDDVLPESLSLWDRFWIWFDKLLKSIFSNSISGKILKYALIGLAIAIIVFIVVKLLGINFRVIASKSKEIEVPFEETQENIYKINFDERLRAALAVGNYRLAVRLLYLKSLKHLSDHRLIDWQLGKTNQTYIAELTNDLQRQEFTKLTYQFEYIWYGEFSIDQQRFEPIHESFNQFNQQIR